MSLKVRSQNWQNSDLIDGIARVYQSNLWRDKYKIEYWLSLRCLQLWMTSHSLARPLQCLYSPPPSSRSGAETESKSVLRRSRLTKVSACSLPTVLCSESRWIIWGTHSDMQRGESTYFKEKTIKLNTIQKSSSLNVSYQTRAEFPRNTDALMPSKRASTNLIAMKIEYSFLVAQNVL